MKNNELELYNERHFFLVGESRKPREMIDQISKRSIGIQYWNRFRAFFISIFLEKIINQTILSIMFSSTIFTSISIETLCI